MSSEGATVHLARRAFDRGWRRRLPAGLSAATVALLLIGALALGRQVSQRGADQAGVLEAVPLAPAAGAPTLAAVKAAWQAAPPLNLTLGSGGAGTPTFAVQARAVYTPTDLYLWLRWPEPAPPAAQGQQQRATVTWRRATAIGGCAVACHASFSTGRRISDLQLVAPDVSGNAPTLLFGAWRDGWWTLGYRRALRTPSPVEVQFSDLARSYAFGLDFAAGQDSVHTPGEALRLHFKAGA